MLIHVLYDTVYGNTEAVAHAIGDALDAEHEVLVAKIGARMGRSTTSACSSSADRRTSTG